MKHPHQTKLIAVPCNVTEACSFVRQYHRHHKPPQGGLFAVACSPLVDGFALLVCGVAIVGNPVARLADNGWTAEVTRVAVLPDPLDADKGWPNACSFLYAATWRAARAMGYLKLITYTLKDEESGKSLEAAGWRCVGESEGGSCDSKSRPRVDKHPTQAKLRWEAA